MADEETFRDKILATVEAFPGIHLRGLVKQLDTSTALARYHLDALIESDTVRAYEVGGFTRYFPTKTYVSLSEKERQMLHVLRQERPLAIVLAFLEYGPMQHRDALEIVGGSKGTLTYQLDKLVEAGVLKKIAKGPDRGFHLPDEEAVRRLLTKYEPIPEVYEHLHDTWDDLFTGHRNR